MSIAMLEIKNDETELFTNGLKFSTGADVEMDLVAAHKWFNLAALKGSQEARERRRELAEVMTDLQISAAQKAARDWLNRASNYFLIACFIISIHAK